MNFWGHTAEVRQAMYSPDGCFIASGSEDNTIRIWDARTGRSELEQTEGHKNIVTQVAYSPDGQFIASCSSDTTIRIWGLVHTYVFQKFYFLNTTMENKIKILLI